MAIESHAEVGSLKKSLAMGKQGDNPSSQVSVKGAVVTTKSAVTTTEPRAKGAASGDGGGGSGGMSGGASSGRGVGGCSGHRLAGSRVGFPLMLPCLVAPPPVLPSATARARVSTGTAAVPTFDPWRLKQEEKAAFMAGVVAKAARHLRRNGAVEDSDILLLAFSHRQHPTEKGSGATGAPTIEASWALVKLLNACEEAAEEAEGLMMGQGGDSRVALSTSSAFTINLRLDNFLGGHDLALN